MDLYIEDKFLENFTVASTNERTDSGSYRKSFRCCWFSSKLSSTKVIKTLINAGRSSTGTSDFKRYSESNA